MSVSRKIFGLVIRGALLGAALALLVPASPAAADSGCNCYDTGIGAYQCNAAENACVAGDDVCSVVCTG